MHRNGNNGNCRQRSWCAYREIRDRSLQVSMVRLRRSLWHVRRMPDVRESGNHDRRRLIGLQDLARLTQVAERKMNPMKKRSAEYVRVRRSERVRRQSVPDTESGKIRDAGHKIERVLGRVAAVLVLERHFIRGGGAVVDTDSERIRDRVENSDASIVLNRAAGDIRRGIERRQRLPRGIQPIGGYDVAGEWETGFRIKHRLPGTGKIAPKPCGVGDRGGTRHGLARSQPPVTYESESSSRSAPPASAPK